MADQYFPPPQVEELGLEVFWEKRELLQAELDKLVAGDGLDFACLMITDIVRNDSILLTAGSEAINDEMNYRELRPDTYQLKGVVSRKKQLFPVLGRILSKLSR